MVRDKNSSIAVVDTQPADGYAEATSPVRSAIPGSCASRNFPSRCPQQDSRALRFLPNDTSDLIKQLAEFGYFNIKVMDGGWYKWVALKYPGEGKGDYALAHPATAQSAVAQAATSQPTVAQSSAR